MHRRDIFRAHLPLVPQQNLDDKLFWARILMTLVFPFVIAYVFIGGLFIYGRYIIDDVADELRTLRRVWRERDYEGRQGPAAIRRSAARGGGN